MKRLYLVLIAIIGLSLGIFFYPKNVGGPLCGPVCPSLGLHYYKQDCLGIRATYSATDWYENVCYGLPLGIKKCYGVPCNGNESGSNDVELDCNYSICSCNEIKNGCKTNEMYIMYDCKILNNRCNW